MWTLYCFLANLSEFAWGAGSLITLWEAHHCWRCRSSELFPWVSAARQWACGPPWRSREYLRLQRPSWTYQPAVMQSLVYRSLKIVGKSLSSHKFRSTKARAHQRTVLDTEDYFAWRWWVSLARDLCWWTWFRCRTSWWSLVGDPSPPRHLWRWKWRSGPSLTNEPLSAHQSSFRRHSPFSALSLLQRHLRRLTFPLRRIQPKALNAYVGA